MNALIFNDINQNGANMFLSNRCTTNYFAVCVMLVVTCINSQALASTIQVMAKPPLTVCQAKLYNLKRINFPANKKVTITLPAIVSCMHTASKPKDILTKRALDITAPGTVNVHISVNDNTATFTLYQYANISALKE
jgi:hypothetical protein